MLEAMKLAGTYLIILTLSCYVLACSITKNVDRANTSPVGDYQYTGYDERGGKVVEGRISITSSELRRIGSAESVQLKGNWELSKAGNQEKIGPQVGKGELIGSIDKDEVDINLNPNINDVNVYLRGKIEGKRFHGTWSFNGYAGPINKGTFEAIRK
jgi:hypothetical protein